MTTESGNHRFVVQHHQSRSPHFDFRLEHDGVFKSWAVPKGVPEDSGIRRLAVVTPDHALSIGDFEGEIAAGEPGAGTIRIWDHGTYETLRWEDDHLEFTLSGTRLSGRYHLVRFHRGGEREWLIFKTDKSKL